MKLFIKFMKKLVKKKWKQLAIVGAIAVGIISSVIVVTAANENFTFVYNQDFTFNNGETVNDGATFVNGEDRFIVGDTVKIRCTASDETGDRDPQYITWTSSNTNICTISNVTYDTTTGCSYCTLTFISPGAFNITGQWNDGTKSFSQQINLNVNFTISSNKDFPVVNAEISDNEVLSIRGLSSIITPSWSIPSSGSSVASISTQTQNGLVSNLHAGFTDATATIGSYEHTYPIIVRSYIDRVQAQTNGYYMSGIYKLDNGSSHVIETNVLDYSFVNFATSNPEIVSIDNSTNKGNMTANSVGTANIYVMLNKKLKDETLKNYTDYQTYEALPLDDANFLKYGERYGDVIEVVVPLKITSGDVTMGVGDTMTLHTNAKAGSTITWSVSSGTGVVTLDSNGILTANSAGNATVTATYKDAANNEYTDTIKVSVYNAFTLNKSVVTMEKGTKTDILAMIADPSYETYYNISVASSNSSVATAAHKADGAWGDYEITANATGEATLTFTLKSNGSGYDDPAVRTATCKVYVNDGVSRMEIDPPSVSLISGNTNLVTANLYAAGSATPLDTGKVFWYSLDNDIATVASLSDRTAQITAGSKSGTTQVVAMSENGTYAYCTVHVTTNIETVTLADNGLIVSCRTEGTGTKYFTDCISVDGTPYSGIFRPGSSQASDPSTYQMIYDVGPDGASTDGFPITWVSLDPSVCTVDGKGLVTFHSSGSSIITLTINNITAICTIEVREEVTGVEIDQKQEDIADLKIGDTLELTATVKPDNAYNKAVTWESSNPSVATVDENGKVKGIGSGNTIITVKTDDGDFKSSRIITVYQPVTGITLSETDVEMRKGHTFYLYATIIPDNATKKGVIWSSSDENIATVNEFGRVYCKEAGEVVITATSEDTGVSASCNLKVIQSITGVSLNYSEVWLNKGEGILLKATITPEDADNQNVTWTSSDPSVATVDKNGVVTTLKGGMTVIVCTTEDRGLTASCQVNVNEYVESIKITGAPKQMNLGDEAQLTAVIETPSATNQTVEWATSNPGVLTVDGKGRIRAVGVGEARITAATKDGTELYDFVIISVIKPVKHISIEPKSLQLYEGQQGQLYAVIDPPDATIKAVEWTTSDEDIADVDFTGTVYAISEGRAKITATSTDGNEVYGQCYVTVKPLVKATRVVINSSEITMFSNQTRQLSAKVYPNNTTETLSWFSTDTSVATVDQYGNVVSHAAGTAEIVCISSYGSVEDSCIVHVVGMNATRITLEQYDDFTLDVYGSTGRIKWNSSNNRVATVDQNGKVIARLPGTTTLSANVNGKVLYCTVVVTKMNPIKK